MIEQRYKVSRRTLLAGAGATLDLAPLAGCVTAPAARGLALDLVALVTVQSVKSSDKTPLAKETVVLQRVSVPGTDREMGMGIAEFPPNSAKPRQKASGPEVVYVVEGEVSVLKGQPAKVFRTGETFQLPADVVHRTTAGPAGAKVVAVWVHVAGLTSRFQTDPAFP
jgi:quercetin dioxygenase-like cupin family protein